LNEGVGGGIPQSRGGTQVVKNKPKKKKKKRSKKTRRQTKGRGKPTEKTEVVPALQKNSVIYFRLAVEARGEKKTKALKSKGKNLNRGRGEKKEWGGGLSGKRNRDEKPTRKTKGEGKKESRDEGEGKERAGRP